MVDETMGQPHSRRVAANQQDDLYTPRTKTQYATQGAAATTNKPCKIPITTLTFKASDIYPKLIPIDAWYWGDHLGKPLGVKPIKHYLHQHDISNYVEERDKYRQDYHDKHNSGEPPKDIYWQDNTLEYTANLHNPNKKF